tara:strand:+ start:217 stop:387 length:171 start_codon:yes stop_codon:yes gene_type:complete
MAVDTTNPFNTGVTYKAFLKNVTGKKTIDSLLNKHNLSKDQKDWIKEELNNYKNNK